MHVWVSISYLLGDDTHTRMSLLTLHFITINSLAGDDCAVCVAVNRCHNCQCNYLSQAEGENNGKKYNQKKIPWKIPRKMEIEAFGL